MKLSDSQWNTLLHIAEVYDADCAAMHKAGHYSLAEHFERQAAEVRELAEEIAAEFGV